MQSAATWQLHQKPIQFNEGAWLLSYRQLVPPEQLLRQRLVSGQRLLSAESPCWLALVASAPLPGLSIPF